MNCVQIVPPAALLTLDEAKRQVRRTDDTDDDEYLTGLIAVAQAQIEAGSGNLGRSIMPQTWELRLGADAWLMPFDRCDRSRWSAGLHGIPLPYVQLTGRGNYRKATQRLRALGLLVAGQDLETNPDLAMHPDVAAAILFIGTREGWFTGKKLADYLGGGKADWKGARRIINGQDRGAEIALHAQAFATALKKAGYAPGAVATKIPVQPVTIAPTPPLVAPAPRNS